MRKMAELSGVKALDREKETEKLAELQIPPDVEVYSINGSFFFGAAGKLLEVDRAIFQAPKVLILDMGAVFHMDTTGLKTLRDIRQQCEKRGTRLILAGVHSQPLAVLQKAKKVDKIGRENFKPSLAKALKDLKD
jgi:SulP family sulfate permease